MTLFTLVLALGALCGIALLGWVREINRRLQAERQAEADAARQRDERETQAREQAQRTAALFDRMVEGLIITDAAGMVRLVNQAAARLFGFTDGATGKSLIEVTRHHEIAALAGRVERDSEILGYELKLESMGAGPRYFHVNALGLKGPTGINEGAILVFHDLTRLRQLEAVRQDFVANVSHELRTPLSLIKSAVETLIDGGKEDPATLGKFLQIIERHANRLALLIDDLLLLSTLDSGRLQLQIDTVVVRPAVQEAMDELAARAGSRAVTLVNESPAALGVKADPERLRQVLINLIDNAIKYGKPGGVVRAWARPGSEGKVEIAVTDDGPGIPPEAQARVFERFYRADKARSREQGGTGLGLAIVKHVVQAHHGDVAVSSTPGQGATFSFTLPASGK